MFENVEIPYGAYWSTPFCRWQGSLANLHSLKFAAHVARAELKKRDIAPSAFDHGVLGMTTPQQATFHGLAWLMSEIGAPQAGGPMVAQACATSARCLAISAGEVEQGTAECSQPIRDMGRVACRRLFEAIAAPGKVEQIQFRMTLLPRESSGRAPAAGEKGHLKPVVRSDVASGGE